MHWSCSLFHEKERKKLIRLPQVQKSLIEGKFVLLIMVYLQLYFELNL